MWHDSYVGVPNDGLAWIKNGDSSLRVVRGGSSWIDAEGCRSAMRGGINASEGCFYWGFV